MTIEELQKIYPKADELTWHRHANGGGWIENTARVSGTAMVYGDAQVSGTARVYGTAQVSGDARVSGGNWDRNPLYVAGTMYSFNENGDGGKLLTSGCITAPREWWAENIRRCAEEHGYTPEQVNEYEMIVKFMNDMYEH